ncbi:nicotinamide-nucleotide amidohydrolase family protein [Acidiphilium acidophilum]|uniref:CinA family protein n=1 Tax=Acidiphilium acidophilum TaxID=76588 RepID=UPI002E8E67B8|nr:nicotinamide-nucleotide amidohydrolase family protein [Acidiphilium acidophilum]
MSAKALVALATARGLRIATAESCTGGMIAAAITDIAGSSAIFGYGFVTYANEAKTSMLGVDPEVIAAEGAVSEAVARAMAAGALQRSGADLAVAVTGIAGPDGGSALKPVGTVWFGLAKRGAVGIAERVVFPGDRAAIRAATVDHALRLLMAAITAS